MTLGDAVAGRIDEYLFARGLSLYKLAKDSGIPLSTMKNLYRKHTKSPTLAVVYKIARGLEITPSEFLDSDVFRSDDLEID